MAKINRKIWVLILVSVFLMPNFVWAAGPCDNIDTTFTPKCADTPTQCESTKKPKNKTEINTLIEKTPPNCIFLEEPIGGEIGYDLFVVNCLTPESCAYRLYRGQAITGTTHGPVQAVLSVDTSKPYQGSFGLLYNYVALVYKFVSGLIIGIVVLLIVVGGIQMTMDAGSGERSKAGKDRIMQALIGMAIWFLASLILYTINPTFFSF